MSNRIILIIVLLAVFVFAGTSQISGIQKDILSGKENLAKDDWRRLTEFFEIVDMTTSKKMDSLILPEDADSFKSLAAHFIRAIDFKLFPETPDTNEWLGEMKKRIDYCDYHYTGASVLGRHWDVRAKQVILLGIPFSDIDYIDYSSLPGRGSKLCMIYVQRWEDGTEFHYEGSFSDTHPDKMVPWDEGKAMNTTEYYFRAIAKTQRRLNLLSPEITNIKGKELEMGIRQYFIPMGDNFEFLVLAGVSTKQFKPDSLNQIHFQVDMNLYSDPSGDFLCDASSGIITIPGRFAKNKETAYPVHLHLKYKLSPGKYKVAYSLKEIGTENKVVSTTTIEAPSLYTKQGMSDILLIREERKQFSKNCFILNERIFIGDIRLIFHKGDSIMPYVKALLPDTSEYARIVVSLHPIPKIMGPNFVADTSRIIHLYSGKIESQNSDIEIINNDYFSFLKAIKIPKEKISKGEYFLNIGIAGVDQSVNWAYAFKRIKIK